MVFMVLEYNYIWYILYTQVETWAESLKHVAIYSIHIFIHLRTIFWLVPDWSLDTQLLTRPGPDYWPAVRKDPYPKFSVGFFGYLGDWRFGGPLASIFLSSVFKGRLIFPSQVELVLSILNLTPRNRHKCKETTKSTNCIYQLHPLWMSVKCVIFWRRGEWATFILMADSRSPLSCFMPWYLGAWKGLADGFLVWNSVVFTWTKMLSSWLIFVSFG